MGGQDELRAAQAVISAVLLHPQTKAVFGEPVDPEALGLPDYFDIVTRPMDLGTVARGIKSSLKGGPPKYAGAADVLADVELVWSNCLAYNSRPEDQELRDLCEASKKLFAKQWKAAGLSTVNPSSQPGRAKKRVSVAADERPSTSRAKPAERGEVLQASTPTSACPPKNASLFESGLAL